jgi:hypothetical protein
MIAEFIRKPVQKPRKIQPDCPVRLYSYVRSVEEYGRAHCVQLRLVNCAEREVESLFLRICGLGTDGSLCYRLESVPLARCMGAPRSAFGEERLIFLPSAEIAELEITVEWVLFSDGMIWKRLPEQRFDSHEALEMVRCACGMWKGDEKEPCGFCDRPAGASVVPSSESTEEAQLPEMQFGAFPVPELSLSEIESMMKETASVLRSMQEDGEPLQEEQEEPSAPTEEELPPSGNHGIWIMLAIVAVLAVVTAFVLYHKGYFG